MEEDDDYDIRNSQKYDAVFRQMPCPNTVFLSDAY
jgi:hypothetical protein